MRLAHDAGVHVGVCVVACLVCQNQFTCEWNYVGGHTHFLCAFTHLRIDTWTAFKRQVFELTLHGCCSILDVRS